MNTDFLTERMKGALPYGAADARETQSAREENRTHCRLHSTHHQSHTGRPAPHESSRRPASPNSALRTPHSALETLDRAFGYKIRRDRAWRCFFRFIQPLNPQPSTLNHGHWHDVLAPHDFGHTEAEVLEILAHEMALGQLVIFGCSCAACAARPDAAALKDRARELTRAGFIVSHGLWPEHEAPELARIEREMAEA